MAKDKLIKNNKWDLIKLTKLAKDKLINKDKWNKQHSKTNNWDEIILCLCYVCTQYKQLTDNLVDVFNYNLNKLAKTSREEVKVNFTNDIGKVQSHIGQLIL